MIANFMFQVFRRNSPYIPDISRAVLEISEKGKLLQLENSMMSIFKCSVMGDDEKTDSLSLNSFGGLFLITLGTSTIALVIFIARHMFTRTICVSTYVLTLVRRLKGKTLNC